MPCLSYLFFAPPTPSFRFLVILPPPTFSHTHTHFFTHLTFLLPRSFPVFRHAFPGLQPHFPTLPCPVMPCPSLSSLSLFFHVLSPTCFLSYSLWCRVMLFFDFGFALSYSVLPCPLSLVSFLDLCRGCPYIYSDLLTFLSQPHSSTKPTNSCPTFFPWYYCFDFLIPVYDFYFIVSIGSHKTSLFQVMVEWLRDPTLHTIKTEIPSITLTSSPFTCV